MLYPTPSRLLVTLVLQDNCIKIQKYNIFTTNTISQLNIFRHYGNTLGVDCAQVDVLIQTHTICLSCILKSHDLTNLEAEISFEILSDSPYYPLEWKLLDQQLTWFLIPPDFTESNHPCLITNRLFFDSLSWSPSFMGWPCLKMFPWSFTKLLFYRLVASTGFLWLGCSFLGRGIATSFA